MAIVATAFRHWPNTANNQDRPSAQLRSDVGDLEPIALAARRWTGDDPCPAVTHFEWHEHRGRRTVATTSAARTRATTTTETPLTRMFDGDRPLGSAPIEIARERIDGIGVATRTRVHGGDEVKALPAELQGRTRERAIKRLARRGSGRDQAALLGRAIKLWVITSGYKGCCLYIRWSLDARAPRPPLSPPSAWRDRERPPGSALTATPRETLVDFWIRLSRDAAGHAYYTPTAT